MSPPVSSRARLQSIIPAWVASRRAFTSAGLGLYATSLNLLPLLLLLLQRPAPRPLRPPAPTRRRPAHLRQPRRLPEPPLLRGPRLLPQPPLLPLPRPPWQPRHRSQPVRT